MLTRHWKSLIRPLLLALVLASPSAAGAVQLDIGSGSGTVGDTVTVAVTTSDLTGLGVYAYEFTVTWSALYASALDAPVAGTLTAPWGSVTANPQNGRIDVAAAGVSALAGSGTLLNLRFVLGPNSGYITLTFADFVFNEGTPVDTLSNGFLSISALPTTNIYPNTGELVVGDSLQFSTSGGTPPYSYSTSDPLVADFLGNDWLNALAPGSVTCTSTDFNGIMSTTTGVINVRALSLTLGSTMGNPGDTVLVAMTITDPSPYAIQSAEFAVTFSASYFTALGIEDGGTLAGAAGWSSFASASPGRIDVSMAGTTPLPGPGTLVYLRVLINGGSGYYTFTPTGGMFNEVYPPKHYTGTVQVVAFPVLNVTPNTQTIVVGDNLQFYVSGSTTPPLTWGVTNGSVASISGTGLLTATAKGQTRVDVVDNVGATDTTDAITICDLYVVAPTQALWPTPTDVPISPDRSVTGMGIYGYELRLSFDPTKVMVTGVNTAGCSTAPWGTPVYNASIPGQVIVVHAGATPLSGSLPLVNVTFQILVSGVSASALTVTKILFNEGDPCALVINGSLSIPTGVSDQTPRVLDLEQNVPNPFNPVTTIGYSVSASGRVRLRVYNTAGVLVRTLVDRQHEGAGRFEARWDGTDDAGRRVATGVYLYRLETAGQQITKKMVLLK